MTRSPARNRLRRQFERLRTYLWWLVTLVLLLLAVYVVLARQLMTMAPDFREPLQNLVADRLGTPVTIGGLRGYLDGVSPVFVLQDVQLPAADADGAPLTLRHVELGIDLWRTLLARELRLHQLWITGLDLHLVRDEDGRIHLRGLEAFGGDNDNPEGVRDLLDLVYRQQRLVLDDVRARVDWPGLPPLRSEDASLALVKEGRSRHLALRFSARDRPFRLDARLTLRGEAYALNEVSGDGYLRVEGEQLEYWLPERWPLPIKPEAAAGRVEFWGALHEGTVSEASAVLATRDVRLRHNEHPQSWILDRLNARFAVRRVEDGYQLMLDEVRGQTEQVGELRAGPLALWWDGRISRDTAWRLRAESLNAAALREQLLAWPFPLPASVATVREKLVALAPSGQVPALYLAGSGARITAFNGRFMALSVAANDRQPGAQGVSGWIAGTPRQGVASLRSPSLVLDMPALFEQPLAASLGGLLQWQRDEQGGLILRSGVLRANNADASGEALLSLALAPEQVPQLSLRAEIRDGNAARAARYIPRERMSDGLSAWLGQAFIGGTLERGRILYEGPLRYDRTRQQERTQQMAFTVRDLGLHFLDGWPAVQGIEGTVLINGLEISGRDLQARYMQSDVRNASVDVVDILPQARPLLVISGEVSGPATDLQTLLRDTPLKEQVPQTLNDWDIRGGALAGHLLLHLPLSAGDPRREVLVEARASQVNLHSGGWRLAATSLTGAGSFSLRGGLQLPALTGELFGSPVKGSVRTDAEALRISAQGAVPMPVLRNWLDKPWLAPLDGTLGYRAGLSLPRGGGTVRLQVDSDLEGVSAALPSPLGKTAGERRAAQLVLTVRDGVQRYNLLLADLLAAQLQLDRGGALSRGALRFGARGVALPDTGLRIDGWLPTLDPVPWGLMIAAGEGPFAGGDGGTPLPPLSLAVDTNALRVQGQDLGHGSLSVQQLETGWHLALGSSPLAGEVFLPRDYTLRGEQPLVVDIERLRWPFGDAVPADERGLDELSLQQLDPLRVPVADISLRNVSIQGRDYGQWQGQVRPTDGGARILALSGRWQDTTFSGELDWQREGADGNTRSGLTGAYNSRNLAALLGNFGLESFIESQEASGSVDVTWHGSPLDFDYRRLGGALSVDIANALLPSTDRRTSALRLLGLINIGNTINRRLRLDFSDVISEGLVADRIRGQFSFDGPRISTDNLRIRSPAAEFAIAGTLALDAQTMDYGIEVTLPLSSNLYAGCLAGPAACAGIFVVERLWGDRLEKMTSMGYRVTGSWDNPKVEEVQGMFERAGSRVDSLERVDSPERVDSLETSPPSP